MKTSDNGRLTAYDQCIIVAAFNLLAKKANQYRKMTETKILTQKSYNIPQNQLLSKNYFEGTLLFRGGGR